MTDKERIAKLEAQLVEARSKIHEAVEAAVVNARSELAQSRRETGEVLTAQRKAESALAVLQDQHTRLKASHERKAAGLAQGVKIAGQLISTLQHAIGDDV